ncbi:hypothetical protein BT63DRAFT_479117 [Microthyrium microscopicum]|uniref:Uncharacterized protein n=1 Tax=Microthyrium microscopicum TaxID=703497 RepID=A0A6A6UAP6_9PEZI|nr:hypothetical protein BT63DRAFT_479117 [Microthyrium microscopicum]
MADDKHHHGVSKFLKERWRSKSNPDEPKNLPAGTGQNLDDFLRPSNSTTTPRTRPVVPLAPKIDIAAAQRWAGNSAELKSGNNGMQTPSSLKARGSQKKPRRPNLTVTFSTAHDIIGEGGEECDDPTSTISMQRSKGYRSSLRRKPVAPGVPDENQAGRSTGTPPPGARPAPSRHDDDMHPGFGAKRDANDAAAIAYRQLVGDNPEDPPPENPFDDFVPKLLKRTPTGFQGRNASGDSRHRQGSMSSMYSDEGSAEGSPATGRPPASENPFKLPEFSSFKDDSPLDFSSKFDSPKRSDTHHSARSPVEVHDKIQRMRQEEGRVLHQNARRSIIELAEDNPIAPQQNPRARAPSASSAESDQIYDMYQSYSPQQDRQRSPEKSRNAPPPPMTSAPPPPRGPPIQREPRLPVLPDTYQVPIQPVATPANIRHDLTPEPQMRQQPLPVRSAPGPLPIPGPGAQRDATTSKPLPSPLSIPGKDNDYFNGARAPEPQSVASVYNNQSTRNMHDYKTPATATSMKTPASAFSQMALEDFGNRCSHMKGVFRLQAEFEKPMSEYTASQWLRAAAWWFVKGRNGLEQLIRGRPASREGTPASARPQELLQQPHVDLAKCWWILTEILSTHKQLPPAMEPGMPYNARATAAASAGDMKSAEFFDGCDILNANLKGVVSSMNKNRMMPPTNALIAGQDQTIWIPYPPFAPDVLPILSGSRSRSLTGGAPTQVFDPLSVMGVADTKSDFAYYRWFVKVSIGSMDDLSEQVTLLCLFSVMRTRNEWHPKVAICTQKELVTICITGDRKVGPSWEDVKWSEQDNSLQIKLANGYLMNAQLNEADYRTFVSMYQKAFAVQTSLFPLDDEHITFEASIYEFQYTDTIRPPVFPMERMKRCRVRLLGKTETRADTAGTRVFYRGQRIMITTSPKNRTLASVSHDLSVQYPVILEMLTETLPTGESLPAMALHVKEEHRDTTLFMVFGQLSDRQMMYSALGQSDLNQDESQYAALRLKKLSIEPAIDVEMKGPHNPLGRMQWQEITVINKDPRSPDNDFGQTVQSDSLRIVAQGAGGTITDRINVGPGELRLRLANDGTPTVTVLRQAQDDCSMTFDRRVAPFTPEQAEELHHAVYIYPTKRTFTFFNLMDLHAFQAAITSFVVKFDSLARSFTISRRRPVTALSKHKRLDAALTRIQVVSFDNDRQVQLLAFFNDDVSWADSLGFVLKGVDVFERYNGVKHGAGQSGVRIVDAKFCLPKSERRKGGQRSEDIDRPFLCLDMPEYPGENDDIWIGFDEDEERERFLAALPAPATAPSRGMSSILRGRGGSG